MDSKCEVCGGEMIDKLIAGSDETYQKCVECGHSVY